MRCFPLAPAGRHRRLRGVRWLALACLAFSTAVAAARAAEQLTLDDVQTIFAQAISRAVKKSPHALIAVTDREGFVLGVWAVDGTDQDEMRIGATVREAGTAAYLSSDQNAFTSRTAQFIIQQNFPPGIRNRPSGPLVGVAFSNLPFSDINRFKRLDAIPALGIVAGQPGSGFVNGSLGTGIPNTRLSGRGGSAPLYKNGTLVGGIGAFSPAADSFTEVANLELKNVVAGKNVDEQIALAGQVGFTPDDAIYASNVTIDGIGVPYVINPQGKVGTLAPLGTVGTALLGFSLHASPDPFPFPVENLGGQPVEIRFPIRDDPRIATPIRGQARLNADEVRRIIANASERAMHTRAGIRLPAGLPMQVFITVVGNPDEAGQAAPVLGIGRTPGATLFSFDVALQKGRTALFFSSDTRAFSSRTVGFLAQNFYPPGLNDRSPGPFGPEVPDVPAVLAGDLSTVGLQLAYSGGLNLMSPVIDFTGLPIFPPALSPNLPTQPPPNPNLPNGITVFPGGFPLYRNGVLIGAVGISGDGVDQDDIVGASASGDEFAPPLKIRADQFTYDGARLPYAKFPRNPDL